MGPLPQAVRIPVLHPAPLRPSLHPGGWLAAASLCLHLYAASGYGWFRDELYFIDCGLHPAWGYVDQPSLVPLLAAALHILAPESLTLLRLPAALADAATILLAAETARVLGGGRFAQTLAALATATAPTLLAFGSILTTDAVQPLTWSVCAYALIRIIRGDDGPRWWLVVAGAATIGLWSKYMLAFWLAGLLLGLLLTEQRRLLGGRWPWIAAAAVGLCVAPNVAWQAAHDFPFLQLGSYTVAHKNPPLGVLGFLTEEIRSMNPAAAPVWLAGLAALLLWRRFADLRALGIAALAVLAAMIALHGKPYYPAGVFPLLFAAGSVSIAAWLPWQPARGLLVAGVAALGAISLPFVVPVLPVGDFLALQLRLNKPPKAMEQQRVGALPQLYADMFGWDTLARMVATTAAALPPVDRSRVVFLGENYGEAAAVDILGRKLGGPPAISGHNAFYTWGPGRFDGSVVLRLGGRRADLLRAYASVEPIGVLNAPLAMPYENGKTLWLCRDRRRTLQSDWPGFRHYD
jgi:hypothetical protein